MAKPQPTRIPSDDCAVLIDGETYHPHEGEWVEMFRGQSVAEMEPLNALLRLQPQMEAARDDPAAMAEVMPRMEEAFRAVSELLAERITGWSWTDMRGRALDNPPTAEALRRLDTQELNYLVMAAQGGAAAEGKGATKP